MSLLRPNPTLRTQSRTSTTQSSGQPGIQCPHTLMYNAPTIAPSWLSKNSSEGKRLLNTATRELKQLLSDNNYAYFQAFLQELSPTASTGYSLWKAVKRTKETANSSLPLQTARGTWGRTNVEKAQTFAEHLASVFQTHPSQNDPEEHLILELETSHQLEPPPRRFRRSEVQAIINNFKAKRSPGYDLITGKILQELPLTAVKYLTAF
jgi:hypothetical protein